MIEEFMLLANMSVAKKIKKDFPDQAFLRHHEPPVQRMLDEAKASLESAGIFIDVSSSGGLQSTLWKYCDDDDYLGKKILGTGTALKQTGTHLFINLIFCESYLS